MRCTHARVWQENSFYRKIALSKSMCMHMYMCVRACLFDMQSLITKQFQTAPPPTFQFPNIHTAHHSSVFLISLSLSLSRSPLPPPLSPSFYLSLSSPPSLSLSHHSSMYLTGKVAKKPRPRCSHLYHSCSIGTLD